MSKYDRLPEESAPLVILYFVVLAAVFGGAILPKAFALPPQTSGQNSPLSQVWQPDPGDGRYKNPVLYADYSDPDVIRVGPDFYLVSSSFNMVPGLPILHSRDLVNWEIIGHAFVNQEPGDRFERPNHGNGVWAPALRFHHGEFFLFYPEPDTGIYMTKAKTITGPWSRPLLIKAGAGWIDPCPFWDDNGNAYLINAFAASRSGIKSTLTISRMSTDGTRLLDGGTIVVDGHPADPTLEGPKLYKRNGWYYIFAPAGGVPTGWQVVYRSKNIYGPYERRVVLAQGSSSVNGPHQGAWVTTEAGEDWFLHFQDQGPYGRVVWLEPMTWKDNWPVVGVHVNAAGTGEPTLTFHKPSVHAPTPRQTPADSDEFNAPQIGPQWQWQANSKPGWAFPSAALGALRLIAIPPTENRDPNLWDVPNVLTQKLPGPAFSATARVAFTSQFAGEETGLVVNGMSYGYVALRSTGSGFEVRCVQRKDAHHSGELTISPSQIVRSNTVYLRATMQQGALVTFSYSEDGTNFTPIGSPFQAEAGRWIGATIGLFALGTKDTGEHGYADYDWFRFTPAP